MSLIFTKKPIYNYTECTTPKLSYIFQAKTAYAGGENALVGWVGIEPTTNGLKGRCSTD
jgi:hypothetical protein